MKKIYWIIGIIFILAIIIGNSRLGDKKPTATIGRYSFDLYVAKTPKEKEIGLSTKKMLEQNAGMLFLFEKPGYYPFWMKNMKFPIDIIFIKSGYIVTIYKEIKPPKTPKETPAIYRSKEPADTVLEINAGLSEKYNFKEKDLVKISNL